MNTSKSMESNATVVEVIGANRDMVGESPVWSAAESGLYWVDIDGRMLRFYREGKILSWELPERAGCIALHHGGGLVAAMETGVFRVQFPAADTLALSLMVPAHFPGPGMRFNDGKVDGKGRLWCTSLTMHLGDGTSLGALYRLDDRGLVQMHTGLVTGNGLAFSPDGRTLYLSDSHQTVRKIWKFDLSADGAISGQTDFCDMNEFAGRPDGAAVDATGAYWSCGTGAGILHEISPSGQFMQKILLPATKPSMCVFGGPDLRSIYVTSISQGQGDSAAGCLMRLTTSSQGLAQPLYSF